MGAMTNARGFGTSWHGDPQVDSQARSFGAVAAEYDRVRPGYPPEVVRWALGTAPQQVVDLGAGTGKLTRVLLEQGHDVTAVEPDAQMRAQLSEASPGARVLEGSGEAIPLPDASIDAVLVAQAWHWMDHSRAGAELVRVLRPGGLAVLVWNLRDLQAPVNAAIKAAVAQYAPELLARAGADSDVGFDAVEAPHAQLRPGGSTSMDNSLVLSVPDLLALMSTWSYVALSPRREELLRAVHDTSADLVREDGTLIVTQSVHAHRFERLPDS